MPQVVSFPIVQEKMAPQSHHYHYTPYKLRSMDTDMWHGYHTTRHRHADTWFFWKV